MQSFIERFLSSSIRSVSAVLGRSHLALDPSSVVRDPPVDAVSPGQGTLLPEADVTNEDVLVASLVSEGTSTVSLAAVLARHPPGTDHPVSDPCVGGAALLVGHHLHTHLHQDVWVVSSSVGQRSPALGILELTDIINNNNIIIKIIITINQSCLPIKCTGVRCLGQAGRGVDFQVDLLGKLYYGDVVVGETVALVVGVLGHVDINFCESSLSCAAEVMFSKSDLVLIY